MARATLLEHLKSKSIAGIMAITKLNQEEAKELETNIRRFGAAALEHIHRDDAFAIIEEYVSYNYVK